MQSILFLNLHKQNNKRPDQIVFVIQTVLLFNERCVARIQLTEIQICHIAKLIDVVLFVGTYNTTRT